MPINETDAARTEETPPLALDLADPCTREFVDHLIALLALEYIERMRQTSDPQDLAAWEGSAETTDIRRNRE